MCMYVYCSMAIYAPKKSRSEDYDADRWVRF
jgi:hypothetical protein